MLREFANSTSRKRTSVIVAAQSTITLPGVPRALWQPSASDKRALRRDLQQLGLAARARTVKAIGAYVLEVTPKQLRCLAALASVASIRPNLFRHRLI